MKRTSRIASFYCLLSAALRIDVADGGTCADVSRSCETWKSIGHCDPQSRYFRFMQNSCALSCGFCTNLPKVSASVNTPLAFQVSGMISQALLTKGTMSESVTIPTQQL
eukprot:gene13343-35489_t